MSVVVSIDSRPEAICDGYKVTHEVEGENFSDSKPLKVSVAIGDDPDNYAVVQVLTRWFSTEDELDEFCELNINRFRIAAQQQAVPDATEWR
jgi:hypothetical protein